MRYFILICLIFFRSASFGYISVNHLCKFDVFFVKLDPSLVTEAGVGRYGHRLLYFKDLFLYLIWSVFQIQWMF